MASRGAKSPHAHLLAALSTVIWRPPALWLRHTTWPPDAVASRSNTFASLAILATPLTTSGVSVAFTPRRPGYGWAMIVHEDVAANITKNDARATRGALGSRICRWSGFEVFADQMELWVMSNCMLRPDQRYYVFVYISGCGCAGLRPDLGVVPIC